jgi:hypothetical protein
MNRPLQFVLLFFSCSLMQAQLRSPWKRVIAPKNIAITAMDRKVDSEKQLFFELDKSMVNSTLNSLQGANKTNEVVIEIPNTNGDLEKYEIHEFSNFDSDLQSSISYY